MFKLLFYPFQFAFIYFIYCICNLTHTCIYPIYSLVFIFCSFISSTESSFRSIDEIRKDLEGANLFPKKDIEFIQEYIATLNKSTSSLDEKEHALVELEYLLHQTDNAVDFNTIGGLQMIVKLLNATEERLVSKAAFVLGSAAQR